MTPTFGIGARPREQWPIVAPKGERVQTEWVVACFCDDGFTLRVYDPANESLMLMTEAMPYCELWKALRELPRTNQKPWVIGHRMRYALERADILNALEWGEVHLPASKKVGEVAKRSGKLAYSMNCLEIDIVAGKNRLKLLDWKNFGFEPMNNLATHSPQAALNAYAFLSKYLEMAKTTGIRINKTTAAQLGWQHARIDHPTPVLMYNLDPQARAMERRSYYGGRNEPYRLGDIEDAVISLDVKSSYASICTRCEVPIYMEREYKAGLNVRNVKPEDHSQWIADVIISTPTADYPVRRDGITIYPTGTFFTTLAWPELRHALQRGRVDKIVRAASYKSAVVFNSYAKWYLESRDLLASLDVPDMGAALKATFNGSLGYTARQKYELLPWKMDIDRDWWIGYTSAPDHSAPIVHAQVLAGVKEWLKVSGEPREAMPFLHATICSWARIVLLEIMEIAGREWVYYCDTDGILVDYRGYANLLDMRGMIGDLPGQLNQRFKSGPCRIQGQKNYKIGDQVICSGLVKTRHSQWAAKEVLSTPTGRSDCEGKVTPFELYCEEVPGDPVKYINVMA